MQKEAENAFQTAKHELKSMKKKSLYGNLLIH